MEEGNVPGLEAHDTEPFLINLRQGVKERETYTFRMISAITTLSFFRAPCNLAEGPPSRNFGLSNEGGLGLLS
jgi:hypothetical protein